MEWCNANPGPFAKLSSNLFLNLACAQASIAAYHATATIQDIECWCNRSLEGKNGAALVATPGAVIDIDIDIASQGPTSSWLFPGSS
jgi:hypothetical protein